MLLSGRRCCSLRGNAGGGQGFEGEGMSSVLGHVEFEGLQESQAKMLNRQLDLCLGAQRRVKARDINLRVISI